MCSLDLEKCLQNSKNAFTDFSPFKMAFLQCKYSSNAAYFGLWHFLPPCLNHCVRHCQGQCQRQCLRKHRQPMIIWRWRTLVCFLLQERTCQASFTRAGGQGEGHLAAARLGVWAVLIKFNCESAIWTTNVIYWVECIHFVV